MRTAYIITILVFTVITAIFWVAGPLWKNYEVTGFDFNSTDNTSKYRISIEQTATQKDAETLNSSNITGYRAQMIVQITAENSTQVYLMPDSTARKISESGYITHRSRSYRTTIEKAGGVGTWVEAELLDSGASFRDPAVIQLKLNTENDTSRV
ncbi:MAG: hypothetical protein ABEK16_05855 [Candidatus Nanohalobium sp.]